MRKSTTPVHIGLGMLAAVVALRSPGLAALLIASFGVYEYWSEVRGESDGYADFWEALLGLSIGAAAIVLVAVAEPAL